MVTIVICLFTENKSTNLKLIIRRSTFHYPLQRNDYDVLFDYHSIHKSDILDFP